MSTMHNAAPPARSDSTGSLSDTFAAFDMSATATTASLFSPSLPTLPASYLPIFVEVDEALTDTDVVQLAFVKGTICLPHKFVLLCPKLAQHLTKQPRAKLPSNSQSINEVLDHIVCTFQRREMSLLEAALWAIHSLKMVHDQRLSVDWDWLETSYRVQLRDAVEALTTLTSPHCREFTSWFFQQTLLGYPSVSFSGFLRQYMPAHVRKSPQNMAIVVSTIKSKVGDGPGALRFRCSQMKELATAIPKPIPKRCRPSRKRQREYDEVVVENSKAVARAVAYVVACMPDDTRTVLVESARTLSVANMDADVALQFLCQPALLKQLNQWAVQEEAYVGGNECGAVE